MTPKIKAEIVEFAAAQLLEKIEQLEQLMPPTMLKEYRPSVGQPYQACPDFAEVRQAVRNMTQNHQPQPLNQGASHGN